MVFPLREKEGHPNALSRAERCWGLVGKRVKGRSREAHEEKDRVRTIQAGLERRGERGEKRLKAGVEAS